MTLMKDPLAIAEDAVNAPMNEEAELHILKFAAGLQVLRGRLVVALSEGVGAGDDCSGCEEYRQSAVKNSGLPNVCHASVLRRLVYATAASGGVENFATGNAAGEACRKSVGEAEGRGALP